MVRIAWVLLAVWGVACGGSEGIPSIPELQGVIGLSMEPRDNDCGLLGWPWTTGDSPIVGELEIGLPNAEGAVTAVTSRGLGDLLWAQVASRVLEGRLDGKLLQLANVNEGAEYARGDCRFSVVVYLELWAGPGEITGALWFAAWPGEGCPVSLRTCTSRMLLRG